MGVVRDGGSGAHDHRVGERPQPVQMEAVLLAGDEVRVAGSGGDEAVQALPELGEREERAGQAQGQIALGEQLCLGRRVLAPAQSSVRARDQAGGLGVRLGADSAEPLPRLFRVKYRAAAGHRVSREVSSETYSPKESTSEASMCFPFSADAMEGRPITPDSVYAAIPSVSRCLRSSARKSDVS